MANIVPDSGLVVCPIVKMIGIEGKLQNRVSSNDNLDVVKHAGMADTAYLDFREDIDDELETKEIVVEGVEVTIEGFLVNYPFILEV